MTNIDPRRLADWLCLAAAPAFAAMALVSAFGGGGNMICSAARGPLAFDGMTAMYLLMAAFHLPPWLRQAERKYGARLH